MSIFERGVLAAMNRETYKHWACQKMIEASRSNIWDGHWACAALALIRLLEDRLVPGELESGIRRNLEKILEDHPNAETYRIDRDYGEFRSSLLARLIRNGRANNSLGHDVIYSYYILDLLGRSGDIPASAELYRAMSTLAEGFAASGPGYVTINGEHKVVHPDGIGRTAERFRLTSSSLLDLFHGFDRPSQMEKGDMQLGHLLTHGHAIVELKLAYPGFDLDILDEAFFSRMDILNEANRIEGETSAPSQDSPSKEAVWNPLEPSYWEHALTDNRHGHFYKYAYSYLKLNRLAERRLADFRSFSRIL